MIRNRRGVIAGSADNATRRPRFGDHAACPTALRPIRARMPSAVITFASSIWPAFSSRSAKVRATRQTRCKPAR